MFVNEKELVIAQNKTLAAQAGGIDEKIVNLELISKNRLKLPPIELHP
jgi:hypothetical protein